MTGSAAGVAAIGMVRLARAAAPQRSLFASPTSTPHRLRSSGELASDQTYKTETFPLYVEDSNGTLVRVTMGGADSGTPGFRLLRIPN